jgi:hypothetical protein
MGLFLQEWNEPQLKHSCAILPFFVPSRNRIFEYRLPLTISSIHFSRLSFCFLSHSFPHCQIRWRWKPNWWCTWMRRLSAEWPRVQPIDVWAVDCIKNTVQPREVVSLAYARTGECFVCFCHVCNEERVWCTNNFSMFRCFHVVEATWVRGKKTTSIMTPVYFLFTGEAVNSSGNTRKRMAHFHMPRTCTCIGTVAVEFLFDVWLIASKTNSQLGKFRWQWII